MRSPPPSRYRVEERNRRLIVIDTMSGAEMGNGYSDPPKVLELSPRPAERQSSFTPPSALQPVARKAYIPTNAGALKLPQLLASDPKKGKLIGLLVGAVVVLGILIATGLWAPALIVMVVSAKVRTIIWDWVKSNFSEMLEGQNSSDRG